MMRTCVRIGLVTAVALAAAAPTSAQVVQSFHVGFGGFVPRGFDNRAAGDVLVENLTTTQPLAFNINEFRGPTIFGEWTVSFNPKIELSAGVSYLNQSVPSVYRDLVNGERGGAEIEQTLKLRMTPITGLVRFLPFGRPGHVQPYAGAGIVAANFSYTETGEFVDTTDFTIFHDTYRANGTAFGPVLAFGVRVPIKGDIYGLNFEYRYQWAVGDTGGNANGFLSDKIDLSGGHFNFGFQMRF